jgi:hypothetical protein
MAFAKGDRVHVLHTVQWWGDETGIVDECAPEKGTGTFNGYDYTLILDTDKHMVIGFNEDELEAIEDGLSRVP